MIRLILKGASGRMGRRIIALAQGDKEFRVVDTVDEADVLIDFSHPDVTLRYLEEAARAKIPAVIGTTGHSEGQRSEIERYASRIPFVLSPNMGIGVNVMWRIVGEAARILQEDYTCQITETHHTEKKDSPSGTAKKIAEIVARSSGLDPKRIPIESIRKGDVVGNHTTLFEGKLERLEITHQALSRDLFAAGALRAARWIIGKGNGIYSMNDVLGL